ncbi:hypothetical protein EDD99_6850 [Streptomyces sp. 846.5]|nr:hypothetical protein [Streptomyces sp. 846.5]TDT98621.1 hypothetical protein EDD99_6850 [Streptomyces sp. 846.5]
MTETAAAEQTAAGFAETAWDREATCWRIHVGGEPMRGPQGQVLVFDSFNQAYDTAQQINVRRADRPLACPECNRLREQARAAVLSGDGSRLADVRVLQGCHRSGSHPDSVRANARPHGAARS